MKDRSKRLIKLGFLVFGILIFLTNCEQEPISLQETDTSILDENGKNNIIKTGKFNDFKKLKSFVNEIIEKRQDEISRTSLEESNNFTILEDMDIYIHTDSTSTTYTLPIQKESQGNFGFSNLVVKFYDDIATTAFIMNYVPSQDYLNSYVNNNQTPFQGTINYESLDYDGSLDDLNTKEICKSIKLTYCNYGGDTHAAGENCTEDYMFDVVYEICYDETDNSPINESIDTPSGPSSGGGSTPDSNPTNPLPSDTCEDSITGEIGLTGSNGECLSSNAFKLTEQLNNLIGENSYSFDNTLSDYEVIEFENFDAFEGFYSGSFDDVNVEPFDTENSDGISETKNFPYNFDLVFLDFTIKIEVETVLPSENSCDCMEVTDVTSILIGNTTIVEWEQLGDHTTQISNDGTKLTVTTRGLMTIGVKIGDFPISYVQLVTFVQEFNHTTGNVVSYYVIRE